MFCETAIARLGGRSALDRDASVTALSRIGSGVGDLHLGSLFEQRPSVAVGPKDPGLPAGRGRG